jgi:hypothetical protein
VRRKLSLFTAVVSPMEVRMERILPGKVEKDKVWHIFKIIFFCDKVRN